MRRIAHISDLHFGTEEPHIVDAILDDLSSVQPHLVVVTGDLTQRARQHEFEAARRFLDKIPGPRLVVPGNHDIPAYNLAARFLWPLAAYRRYIDDDVEPTFADDQIAVAGVNTARSNTGKDGRVSKADIERLRQFFCRETSATTKILAAHHPFIPPERDPSAALVGRATDALHMLADCGCHVILAGHLHHAYAGDVRPHHVEVKRSILVIQAGTAVSRRRRGEANGYNLLTIEPDRLRLEVRTHQNSRFVPQTQTAYAYAASGWHIEPKS
jgi:3',5'-cyclic AMP phosphodiesterase CpdA